ncbi:class I glutamine amidotransferase-like protein [Russula aff. rugulosa BPL654]|nr:class I glutamine amidotransferase-like protein [Russula aff. rugulosa BPL654]
MSQRILFVFTSVSESLQGDDTGWYLPEAAHPYYILSPHFTIDFAAPGGPRPSMDPSSEIRYRDDEDCKRFLEDSKVKSLLENTKRLRDVNSDDYIAIYYLGGRGPVIDLPDYEPNIELAEKFYRSGKLVSAVCHGPAALVFAAREDGVSIFNGKEATGFSDTEEHQVGRLNGIPFSVEKRMRLLGATYVKAKNPWDPKVVQSGNLLTGRTRNPLGLLRKG